MKVRKPERYLKSTSYEVSSKTPTRLQTLYGTPLFPCSIYCQYFSPPTTKPPCLYYHKVSRLLHIHTANLTIVNTNPGSVPYLKFSLLQIASYLPKCTWPSLNLVLNSLYAISAGLLIISGLRKIEWGDASSLLSPGGRGAMCTFKPLWLDCERINLKSNATVWEQIVGIFIWRNINM